MRYLVCIRLHKSYKICNSIPTTQTKIGSTIIYTKQSLKPVAIDDAGTSYVRVVTERISSKIGVCFWAKIMAFNLSINVGGVLLSFKNERSKKPQKQKEQNRKLKLQTFDLVSPEDLAVTYRLQSLYQKCQFNEWNPLYSMRFLEKWIYFL